jgi:hypothetical protein
MKTIDELVAEWDEAAVSLGENAGSQVDFLRERMVEGLNRNGPRMRTDVLQQHLFNWQMQLFEGIIRILVEEDEVDNALAVYRQFAQHSHLVAQYNALLVSMKQVPKLEVATVVPKPKGDPNRRKVNKGGRRG